MPAAGCPVLENLPVSERSGANALRFSLFGVSTSYIELGWVYRLRMAPPQTLY